ncbi:MAG: cardiolipin synthase [Coriobacteriia bacterium]|nr:cardiolipin synthase [Coriobacteriia bacterium]
MDWFLLFSWINPHIVGWLAAALILYWIVVVVALIAADRDPSTTLAWILILFVLPGFGMFLYYFLGRNWAVSSQKDKWLIARRAVQQPHMSAIYEQYRGEVETFMVQHNHRRIEHIVKTIYNQTSVPPLPARDVEYWFDGATYFPELIADLASATESIHLQYFIWEDDELTRHIIDVLVERLEAGVEVRILNDLFGCFFYSKKDLRRVKAAGGEVLYDVTSLKKLNYRNHRKIAVVDGVLAHTGGFNIGQEYIDGGTRYETWRDTGMRFHGPAVVELQNLFCERWYEVAHTSLWSKRYFPLERIGSGDTWVQVASQGVEDRWHASTNAYEQAISAAYDYVWIETPYYVPIDTVADQLINAAFAGVDVRIILTGVPDKKIAWYAAHTYFRPLLEAGVRVFLYQSGFFHPKSLVFDDAAAAVGTMNVDVRSLVLHKELMVWAYDAASARINKEVFLADQAQCAEVTFDYLDAISHWDRFRNSACRLASRLL